MGAAASTHPSNKRKRKKKRESAEIVDLRRQMREGFRTLQVAEGVVKTREEIMKQRCGMDAIEEDDGDEPTTEEVTQIEARKDNSGETEVVVEHKTTEGGMTRMDEKEITPEETEEARRAKADLFKDQGNAFIRQKRDLKSAIKAYSTAISFLQTNYIYYNNRAAAYLLAGHYDSAIADCDSSLALCPNMKAYTRKASALGELGRFDSAIECVEKALAMDSKDPETLHVQEVLKTLREERLASGLRIENDTTSYSPKRNDEEKFDAGLSSLMVTPTDKIKLQPLGGSSRKKRQRNNITFPTGSQSSFAVRAIGLPGSFLEGTGRILRFCLSDIESIVGPAWSLPALELSSDVFEEVPGPEDAAAGAERLEKVAREHFSLKEGQGGVFRARNARSGSIGGLCVWKYDTEGGDGALDCMACWNPCEYTHDFDWAVGDKVELLDFLPSLFMKINRSLQGVEQEDNGSKKLCLLSSFKVVGSAAWGCNGEMAAFGNCGLVGDRWGALTLEADLSTTLENGEAIELVGIRTDCIKLPFSVEVRSVQQGGGLGKWQECLTGALGPYVELPSVQCGVGGVRLVWQSTDMHMMDGLCSARAGGGLHVQVIAACRTKSI
mmetsp:Transcript_21131/g.35615  ORF Transcript_21131/g.35615 Transcript_21131/m.35615 type:complete len:610 (-) Transcript_21131:150-1979(-)